MALDPLAVWTIPPDWSEGVTETLEWLTGLLDSPLGTEQRFALRVTPRRSFEATFKPVGMARSLFDMFIERAGGSEIWLPVWHDANRLYSVAGIGSDQLAIGSTDFTEFRDSPGIFIQGHGPFEYELVEFVSQTSSTITVADPLLRDWPVGTRVFPMMRARLEAQPQATRKADRAFQVRVKFSSTLPNTTQSVFTFNTYLGDFVLEIEPNDVTDLTFEYQRLLAELDNQTGKRTRIDLNPYGSTVQQFAFYSHRRARQAELRALFYELEGRRNPLWVPTFFSDLEPTEALSGAASLTVKRCGFTDFSGPFRGREYILVHLKNGTRYYRQILSSALIGDGSTESIILNSGFPSTIPVSSVHRISFLSMCRLDQDAIEITHHTDTHGMATVTTLFRSLPHDRVPVVFISPSVSPSASVSFSPSPSGSVSPSFELDTKFYFEARVPSLGANGGGAMIGIAGGAFELADPSGVFNGNLLQAGSNIHYADGLFYLSPGTNTAKGYPTAPPGALSSTLGDWIGVAVDLDLMAVWFTNATGGSVTWLGNGGPAADPGTGINGCSIGVAGDVPITGPIYILGGSYWMNFGAVGGGKVTINAGETPFIGSVPAGFTAWDTTGGTAWSPADRAATIVLSDANLSLVTTYIPCQDNSWASIALARSTTSKSL